MFMTLYANIIKLMALYANIIKLMTLYANIIKLMTLYANIYIYNKVQPKLTPIYLSIINSAFSTCKGTAKKRISQKKSQFFLQTFFRQMRLACHLCQSHLCQNEFYIATKSISIGDKINFNYFFGTKVSHV